MFQTDQEVSNIQLPQSDYQDKIKIQFQIVLELDPNIPFKQASESFGEAIEAIDIIQYFFQGNNLSVMEKKSLTDLGIVNDSVIKVNITQGKTKSLQNSQIYQELSLIKSLYSETTQELSQTKEQYQQQIQKFEQERQNFQQKRQIFEGENQKLLSRISVLEENTEVLSKFIDQIQREKSKVHEQLREEKKKSEIPVKSEVNSLNLRQQQEKIIQNDKQGIKDKKDKKDKKNKNKQQQNNQQDNQFDKDKQFDLVIIKQQQKDNSQYSKKSSKLSDINSNPNDKSIIQDSILYKSDLKQDDGSNIEKQQINPEINRTQEQSYDA